MNEFAVIWDKYGWVGFLLYVLVKEIMPLFRDRILPAKIASEKKKAERMSKLEERQSIAEDRQTIVIAALEKSVQQMTVAITTNNERLSILIANALIHNQETTEFIHERMRKRKG